ncbi:hypothetical protein BDY17DRAFT_345799 [Neohortaea acidophila]|uniref:Uncharacterized protein n=1 Tax=Neohortaea acidophila TaxID=245834 RepID=A0A6A6PSU9_9PEZI|nr:uncharacterized protein BDY17DRAFT_345799 [Neohortaea acidophila]KAF2483179.1 hypothetical protein BDY17DRAFT_345799 [Neohortaea acidophila]
MRRAVADSDDDEDYEIIVGADGSDLTRNLYAEDESLASFDASIANLDGTVDKSTDSTERLRREIRQAELGLRSTNNALSPIASTSPDMPSTNKRRHASTSGVETSPVPSRAAKRAKTLKTYSASAGTIRHTSLTAETSFDRAMDEASALHTSQSVHFSEHSSAAVGPSSVPAAAALPSASLQQDFMDHEPNMMFHDSGSTIADRSSEEERMLAQTLAGRKITSTPAIGPPRSGAQHSSSIPFTASEHGNSAKSSVKHPLPGHVIPNEATLANDMAHEQPNDGAVDGTPSKDSHADAQTPIDGASDQTANPALPENFNPSPIVEIPRHESTTRRRASDSTQTSTRGRKQKTQEDKAPSDPLNSDDKAIGLPKERYQPRPRRRRATGLPEEEIDYSVRPEKAAKVKRVKSSGAATSSTATLSAAKRKDAGPEADQNAADDITTLPEDDVASKASNNQAHVEPADPEAGTEAITKASAEAPSTLPDVESSHPTKDKPDTAADEIFVKPAKPAPAARNSKSSRSKRSHTTIFEDHVELVSPRHATPSLSQQQAKRKSALANVQNEASKKKRKVVDSDDEDEAFGVDENDESEEVHDSPPKKRGRGRPPKSTTKAQRKSAETVTEEQEDKVDAAPDADKTQTKKRGSGRPPSKAASEAPDPEASNASTTPENPLENPAPDKGQQTPAVETATDRPSQDASKIPTPSPEKQVTAAPEKSASKTSPTSHSPIKSSLAVPLRVGLSRRQRIPSLLRMVKPVRPRKEG